MKVEIKELIETTLEYVVEDNIFVEKVGHNGCICLVRPKDDVDWFNHKHPDNYITVICEINDLRILSYLKRMYIFTNKGGFYL